MELILLETSITVYYYYYSKWTNDAAVVITSEFYNVCLFCFFSKFQTNVQTDKKKSVLNICMYVVCCARDCA
jgi:hypothetical protein